MTTYRQHSQTSFRKNNYYGVNMIMKHEKNKIVFVTINGKNGKKREMTTYRQHSQTSFRKNNYYGANMITKR
jgi:hypothetical protein